MGPERLRICQQVARGEHILVLFCGVGMDAMQIVGRTEATVLAVELNPIAYQCAQRGLRMLVNNKAVKCPHPADRLSFIHGDALEVMSRLEPKSFDRVVAPRPKEGDLDGDLGRGDAGLAFLRALLPLMKDHGECHWYDLAADWELPTCERTRSTIESVCHELGLQMDVIHVAKVGSVAKRQLRVCVDFRIRIP
jgi:tRNA G37 N-methylase Trm5